MKMILISFLLVLSFFCSCESDSADRGNGRSFVQVFIADPDSLATPGISISGVTLVSRDPEKDKADAIEILALKHKWPLAMKTKDKALFEEILAKDFVFRAEDEFFNRSDYIQDRVNGTWTIDFVLYQNLVVQIFGQYALLTYRNILDGTTDDGIPDREYYSWADMYTKADGTWKILGSHLIEGRMEYTAR